MQAANIQTGRPWALAFALARVRAASGRRAAAWAAFGSEPEAALYVLESARRLRVLGPVQGASKSAMTDVRRSDCGVCEGCWL